MQQVTRKWQGPKNVAREESEGFGWGANPSNNKNSHSRTHFQTWKVLPVPKSFAETEEAERKEVGVAATLAFWSFYSTKTERQFNGRLSAHNTK